MKGKDTYAVGEAEAFPFFAPVAVITPAVAFVGMAIPGPTLELVKEHVFEAMKGGFGRGELVVVAPALDDGVEDADERGLGNAPVLADEVAEAVTVAVQGIGRGFDERLEAGAIAESASVIFPHRILANVRAEKVETKSVVVGFEGVADAGFVRVEFQAQGSQPVCRHLA